MPKRLTTEEFIEKARAVHGDIYDYSKVEYINNQTKVCIICPVHGEFWQTPGNHLHGYGCNQCAIEKRKTSSTGKRSTAEEFIRKAIEIHGNKYDYSKVNYINRKTNVCIICPEHGEFWQQPSHHLQGSICPKCADLGRKEKLTLTNDDVIERLQKVRGDRYDYSKVKYTGWNDPIVITCKEHGDFVTTASNALDRRTIEICPYCCDTSHIINTEHFIFRARQVHGNIYDYSKVKYGKTNEDKVCIVCSKHGEFWQSPVNHLQGKGCPKCAFEKNLNISISQGELEVMNILNKHNIEYKTQVPIESTINNTGWMYVDFYIPSMNTIIEYNGQQHYTAVKGMGGELRFEKQQARDEELRQYCKDNSIKLIEIRYDEDVWVELEAQLFNENTNYS